MTNELIYLVKGIDKPTNEYLGRNWKGERVNIEIIKIIYFNKNSKLEKVGVAVDGKKLGIFELEPPLPLGTKAKANIEPVLGATVLANYQNNQIKIGMLKKYDYQDISFESKAVKLTIEFVKNNDNSNPLDNSKPENRLLISVAKIGEKTVGEIKKESIPVLTKLGVYKPGAVLDVILTRTEPYNTVLNLKIDPNTIVTPKLGINMQSSTNSPAAHTTAYSKTMPAQIVIERINFYQWKNTHWNGDLAPLEVSQNDLPTHEKYYIVKA